MDEEPDAHPIEILRGAFEALNASHPELVAKLSAAITSSRDKEAPLPAVEAVFREAARALLPTDRDAAETLFTFAEVLAQTNASNEDPSSAQGRRWLDGAH